MEGKIVLGFTKVTEAEGMQVATLGLTVNIDTDGHLQDFTVHR
jgi:hypothetical protein